MFLYRVAPGQYAVAEMPGGALRILRSDPFQTPREDWVLGEAPASSSPPLAPLAPVIPGKIVGIGRNYKEHVKELSSPMPAEPVIFLKATTSLIGPGEAVVVPPESQRVEHEGEIAVVVGARLKRATEEEARRAIFGITACCDVTARDLQRKDPTFARAKSFDTFCPLGPAVWIGADPENLEVITRVNGTERQHGHTRDMTWGIVDLLVYTSRMMTLLLGDVILTGSPAGVGPLVPGDRLEVEIPGLGVLANPVEALTP
ncbi:MAG TPA: fumarylacetoacetate hydrolase family protein [Thermoanaerobaculia bacterium]|jgi:2-keto-4-pentenoate hydratase/2-oxohepta-3-ene-1,7-dioic acid hydratase in catechol pathway|nr:fumarylacetoacetate hydrolase family protein [Thermoanaerobaculia bacterium]